MFCRAYHFAVQLILTPKSYSKKWTPAFCSVKYFWDAAVVAGAYLLHFNIQSCWLSKMQNPPPPSESRFCMPPGACQGSCPGGLLRYQPAWFSEDTFQLHWSMSFEGYVVVFWPLNAYKCHGCCKNLILLVLGAGFPCKRERTQKDRTLSRPRLDSKLCLLNDLWGTST